MLMGREVAAHIAMMGRDRPRDPPLESRQSLQRAHQLLVFRVAPIICVLLTAAMLLGTTSISRGIVCFFTYSLLHLENSGIIYVDVSSQRNVVTLMVMVYLPVLYLWKATGRLAKVKGGCVNPEPLFQWQRRPLNLKGQKAVAEYLRYLGSINLKVWKASDYWNLLVTRPRGRTVSKTSSLKKRSSKEGSGKANVRGQEARKGGQKDWKELKKAWALKSWTESPSDVLSQYNSRFALYRRLPLKSVSRAWGRLNQMRLPVWLRSPLLRLYIWMFSCLLEEAACTDLKTYHNLSEFFRRQLKRGVRPVHPSHCMVSPADGRILQHGVVTSSGIEQVKGVTYSLKGFLGPLEGLLPSHEPSDAETVERLKRVSSLHLMTDLAEYKPKRDVEDPLTPNDDRSYLRHLLVHPENVLHYCIIYLAPGDYHRYHSPADWTVFARRHFPGELYSVNPGVARWLQGLFNFNERAVYTGSWRYGFFSMTPVGATNVGSINVYFDEDLTTNEESHEAGTYFDEYFASKNETGRGLKIHKGQAIGDFNLGSTIVLLFEAPDNFRFQQAIGQKVKVGQSLGTLV